MKRAAVLLLALGLGEWFALTHGGPQPWSTADWLIATMLAGPLAAAFPLMVLAVAAAVIAHLKYGRR